MMINEWAGFQLCQVRKSFQKGKILPPEEGNLHDITIHPTNTAYSAFEKDSFMVIPNKIRIRGKTAKK